MDCLFCQVASEEAPATIIYQDDLVIAFDDIYPKAPVHKLIIPIKHIATLNDLTADDTQVIGHMVQTAKHLANELSIAGDGYRLIRNCNAGGGQVIYHIHLHLLGGRSMEWPPG